MTLSGFLPPIWVNGSMLVDGGYLNVAITFVKFKKKSNRELVLHLSPKRLQVLPADVMASLGADTIIAVDVAPSSPMDQTQDALKNSSSESGNGGSSRRRRRHHQRAQVDQGPASSTDGMFDYGASLSGWWVL